MFNLWNKSTISHCDDVSNIIVEGQAEVRVDRKCSKSIPKIKQIRMKSGRSLRAAIWKQITEQSKKITSTVRNMKATPQYWSFYQIPSEIKKEIFFKQAHHRALVQAISRERLIPKWPDAIDIKKSELVRFHSNSRSKTCQNVRARATKYQVKIHLAPKKIKCCPGKNCELSYLVNLSLLSGWVKVKCTSNDWFREQSACEAIPQASWKKYSKTENYWPTASSTHHT